MPSRNKKKQGIIFDVEYEDVFQAPIILERQLVFPGRPHSWKVNNTGRGGIYGSTENKKAMGKLVRQLRENYPDMELQWEGGVTLGFKFLYPKPRKWFPGKMKTRPDIDNLIYTPMNAFKGVIWHDDEQVQSYDSPFKGYYDGTDPVTIMKVTLYEPVYK